ncbi:MAG: cyclic nucleotide-binding domain-containing protein [Gammaproteobacteria bacterium]|nr:cyclic nucleotide-binding domain-containing protein [Gammaproteobacteria bacterium]
MCIRDSYTALRTPSEVPRKTRETRLMTAVQALQGIHLLKDLDAATLSVVGAAASTHTFDAGQDICREGQAADGLYLIRTGSVRVTKSGSDADVVILGSGSHFGELGLVDEAPHSATVTASERCEMIKISTTTLRDKLAANPVAAAAFYRAVARSIAKRLRVTTDDLAFARQLALEQHRH